MKAIVGYTNNINGEVTIHGSKNAALPIICSSILFYKKVQLSNIPNIIDINQLNEILRYLNINITANKDYIIYEKNKNDFKDLLINNVSKIRASYYLWGSILSSKNKLKTFYPGGCNFQDRPLDIHFNIFKKFGFSINLNKDYIEFTKVRKVKKYINIYLSKKSFGATINAILLSVKSNKIVKIYNYPNEPEILDFINFLNKAGSKIEVKKTHIKVLGIKKLKEIEYKIMQDRIEAGSYILLSLAHPNSLIKMKYTPYMYIKNIVDVFVKLGGKFSIKNNYLYFMSNDKINDIKIICDVYPMFPTDLQQILCSILLSTNSKVKDLIYPKRISHLLELKKLNANITIENDVIITKPSILKNNHLSGIDLRGNFALLIASSKIMEDTIIDNIDNLLRGYQDIEYNLNNIGVNFKII